MSTNSSLLGVQNIGLEVVINDVNFLHYTDLTINKSIQQFVDTFSITVSNPASRYSTSIPVGAVFQVYFQNVEIFRGVVEQKTVRLGEIESTMTLSGREELVYLTEDDVDPTLGPFKNISDNDIIELVVGSELPWEFELGDAHNIKELAIPTGSTRKGQIIEQVVKYHDYFFYKDGITLKKQKIPTAAYSAKTKFRLTVRDGEYHLLNSRILNVSLVEDISGCRSEARGYTYQSGKAKKASKETKYNEDLISGRYASRLRNRGSLTGYAIKRVQHITAPAKDVDELQTQMDRAIFESDIECSVSLTVYGIFDINLLEIVDIQIEQEGIVQYMYVSGIVYSLDSSNKITTTITCTPFPKNFDS